MAREVLFATAFAAIVLTAEAGPPEYGPNDKYNSEIMGFARKDELQAFMSMIHADDCVERKCWNHRPAGGGSHPLLQNLANSNSAKYVKILCEQDSVDTNIPDAKGRTPMFEAMRQLSICVANVGQEKCRNQDNPVECIREQVLDDVNLYGDELACSKPLEVINLLISAGATPWTRSNDKELGISNLHERLWMATKGGAINYINDAIRKGASPYREDFNGRNSYDIAREVIEGEEGNGKFSQGSTYEEVIAALDIGKHRSIARDHSEL